MLFVPFLVTYCIAVGTTTGNWVGIGKVCLSMLIAAILSMPSLVSPLFELDKIVAKEQLSGKETLETFSTIGVPWHAMFNRESISEIDILSRCFPGRLHILGLVVSLFLLYDIRSVVQRRLVIIIVLGAMAALSFSEKEVASLLVNLVPPIMYVQFPWRFLGIFNLLSVAAIATVFSSTRLEDAWLRSGAACVVLALCVITYYPNLPSTKGVRYKTDSREQIQRSMTTLDHENKYMPVNAKTFETQAAGVLLSAPTGQLFELPGHANDYNYKVSFPSSCQCKFSQYWFDGWRAEVDGREISLLRDKEGLCLLSVPEGEHIVRVFFGRTGLRTAALGLSIAGWMVILAFTVQRMLLRIISYRCLGRISDP